MPDRRTYSEDQVREIMRRATQKQRESTDRHDPNGLSLDEIKRIANELGVDPDFIEQAAGEIGSRQVAISESRWLGGPTEVRVSDKFAGRLDDRAQSVVAQIIRKHSGQDSGRIETIGSSLTWRSSENNAVPASSTVVDAGDHCTIDSKVNLNGMGILLQLPFFLLAMFSLLAYTDKGQPLTAAILILSAIVLAIGGRYVFAAMGKTATRRLTEGTDEIVASLSQLSAASGRTGERTPEPSMQEPSLSIPETDAFETDADSPQRHRERD
ncbi:MAG: hypothetical protein KDD65_12255 [Bacteroidetes bacterium]|nr:hypothetical protein [Bacteroidota bacterium]